MSLKGGSSSPKPRRREPSLAERHEHEGRTPQPGVPAGPRNTQYPSASGYEYSPQTYAKTGLTPPKKTAARRARRASQRKKALSLTKPKVRVKPKAPEPYKAPKLTQEERQIVRAVNNAKPLPKAPKPEAPVALKPRKQPKVSVRPQRKGADPAVAVMSSVPGRGPAVTKRRKRAARTELRKAKKAVRRTRPSLAGLAPEEKAVVPLARKAHRKYPDVPASLLMSLMRQESGFDPAAVSSANAQGLTQFIPSTAASYGVKYGTGPKEKQSQVTGAAKLLTDSNFAENPKEALTRYTGGYSDAEYNNPVLEGAKDYAVVDKSGSPKAVRRYQKAVKEAEKLGMKVGKPAPDIAPSGKYVKVRADAKGMVQWVEAALGTDEGTAKQQRWADKTGLGYTEPWCANFVSNGLLRRGITKLPANPNYVPSYEEWGAKYAVKGGLSKAKPGDLLTFSGRHIGVYVGNGEMISGNSSDSVSRTGIDSDLSMVIRPPYKGGFVKVKAGTPLPGSTAVTSTVSGSSAPAATGLVAGPSTGTAQEAKPKATRAQKVARTNRKLKELGVSSVTETPESPSTSVLDELEAKYGVAA